MGHHLSEVQPYLLNPFWSSRQRLKVRDELTSAVWETRYALLVLTWGSIVGHAGTDSTRYS
jgi:hypothetical protein